MYPIVLISVNSVDAAVYSQTYSITAASGIHRFKRIACMYAQYTDKALLLLLLLLLQRCAGTTKFALCVAMATATTEQCAMLP
jgi:hypothetical protein